MWIRKLYRLGDSVAVTIPRDVMRMWDQRGARYVELLFQAPSLIVTPLSMEDLVHHPRSEEEDVHAPDPAHPQP